MLCERRFTKLTLAPWKLCWLLNVLKVALPNLPLHHERCVDCWMYWMSLYQTYPCTMKDVLIVECIECRFTKRTLAPWKMCWLLNVLNVAWPNIPLHHVRTRYIFYPISLNTTIIAKAPLSFSVSKFLVIIMLDLYRRPKIIYILLYTWGSYLKG